MKIVKKKKSLAINTVKTVDTYNLKMFLLYPLKTI